MTNCAATEKDLELQELPSIALAWGHCFHGDQGSVLRERGRDLFSLGFLSLGFGIVSVTISCPYFIHFHIGLTPESLKFTEERLFGIGGFPANWSAGFIRLRLLSRIGLRFSA